MILFRACRPLLGVVNVCTVEVWEWISNFIPHITDYYLSVLGLKLNHVSKMGHWWHTRVPYILVGATADPIDYEYIAEIGVVCWGLVFVFFIRMLRVYFIDTKNSILILHFLRCRETILKNMGIIWHSARGSNTSYAKTKRNIPCTLIIFHGIYCATPPALSRRVTRKYNYE